MADRRRLKARSYVIHGWIVDAVGRLPGLATTVVTTTIATLFGQVKARLPRFRYTGAVRSRSGSTGRRIAGRHRSWIDSGVYLAVPDDVETVRKLEGIMPFAEMDAGPNTQPRHDPDRRCR